MAAGVNRQILLVEKPVGKLGPEHFRLVEAATPEPKDGEALVRVRLISLDAANRAWMHGATYRPELETNAVMAGGGVAEVVESKAPGLAVGDLVFGDTGWQDYAAAPGKLLSKLPRVEPMTHLLSVYGIAGLTAYFGLLDVGRPQSRRNGRRLGGCGVGRIDRRSDRQDQRMPRDRDRRRRGEMPMADRASRFRRRGRLQGRRVVQGAARRRAEGRSTSISTMSAARFSKHACPL